MVKLLVVPIVDGISMTERLESTRSSLGSEATKWSKYLYMLDTESRKRG